MRVAVESKLQDEHQKPHVSTIDLDLLKGLTDEEADELLHTWEFWARPNQLEPDPVLPNGEHWVTWLILAGRGFGKTRCGAETVIKWARPGECKRIALVAEDSADARDVMVEGESGIMACSAKDFMPKYEPSKRRLTWPNGAQATLFSAEDYDSLRGPQFDGAWCDELCLVAGTLVKTEFGDKPIEEIQVGERVWTREGLKRITKAQLTDKAAELHTNGYIKGTGNHPVWTSSGFQRLTDQLIGDTVAVWQNTFYIMDEDITSGVESIRTVKGDSCLESSGKRPMDQSRPAMTFTTETKTPIITSSTTLSSLLGRNMSYDTSLGASLARTPNGERTILESMCGMEGIRSSFDVPNAKVTSSPSACELSTAIPIVKLEQIAVSEKLEERAAVYNLEVEDCNEFFANGILVHNCKWRYAQQAWDNLMFGLRLGEHPKVIVTTTPRPITLLKEIVLRSDTAITKGTTMENLGNLAPPFRKAVVDKYFGTRLGRQELNAEILDDVPGALWSRGMIDQHRIAPVDSTTPVALPFFERVIVSIDPAKELPSDSSDARGKGGETGIMVTAKDANGHGYLLEDLSIMGSPEEWGRAAVIAFDEWSADMIVYEANQGGEMVAAVLRSAARALKEDGYRTADFVPLKDVHATRGKYVRAEPVSQLYEQGKIHHVGFFAELEDQLVEFTPDGSMGYSPDRMDALVWGFTELMVGMISYEGLMDYYRQESRAIGDRLSGKTKALPGATISLKGPSGINRAYGREGDEYLIQPDGYFHVKEHDVKPLQDAGFLRVFDATTADEEVTIDG